MQFPPLARRSGRTSTLAIAVTATALVGTMAAVNYALGHRAERRNPARGHFVEAEGVRLHFLEQGSGPPVILLHGNGAMAEDFVISGVFGRLAAQYRVIAFDRPGFGHSDRSRDRLWTAAEQASLVWRALRELDIRSPLIVGHSWGTLVALEMALAAPLDTSGLVLVSGYYVPTPRMDVPMMAGPAIPLIGDVFRYAVSPLLGWLAAPALFRKLFHPARVTKGFRKRFPVSMALRPWQVRAMAADSAMMIPGAARLAERYSGLRVPAIILGGKGDRIVSTDRQARRLHQQLHDSQLWIVEGAGHMLHHTHPEEVIAAVDAVKRPLRSGGTDG